MHKYLFKQLKRMTFILAALMIFAMSIFIVASQNVDCIYAEADGAMEVSSEAGSYTVDFYYTSKDGEKSEYHLKGGSEITLSELFKELGIDLDVANIKETDFTDNELVKFVKEGDDYRVISLKPFDTEETFTITFTDGEVIVIGVEDSVTQYGSIPNSNGKAYYEFDSATGELRIRALNAATETAYVNGNFTNKNQWPWDNIRSQVKKISFTTGNSGFGVGFAGVANCAFEDMINLTEVDFSGMGEIRATGIARMFKGSTSLTTIDMSSVTTNGNLSNMQNMFNGCTSLKTVTLNNPNFKTRNVDGLSGAQLTGMFKDCTSLEEVNMSNITLTGNDKNLRGLDNPFTGSSVKKIIMDNVKFENVKTTEQFMKSLSNLEEVSMTGNIDARSVQYMTEMFAQNPSLKKIDVSGFGKLDSIVNMQDFVKDDTALETLIIDNLDNSHIGPTNNHHRISEDNSIQDNNVTSITGAAEYGRELGIETCTALKTLSAKNSKVWMVKNSRGVPGAEYFNAAEASETYYFTKKIMSFAADAGPTVIIDSDRDYIDLITDRDGTNVPNTKPKKDTLPDASTNINIANGDLNTNGAGYLAPGVYTIQADDRSDPPGAPMEDTYYRIAYVGNKPYSVDMPASLSNELVLVQGASTTINTVMKTWPTNDEYEIDCAAAGGIKITYKNVAIDANGKVHDVVVTINKITFKDLDKVPHLTDSLGGVKYTDRIDDDNVKAGKVLADENQQYYRPVLQATQNGINLNNYIYAGTAADPNTPGSGTRMLTGGAGTDIEFTIEVADANPDTSFVFLAQDLDVPYSQNWQYNANGDACYDKLTVQNVTYGDGGEGFVLGSGVRKDTVQFASETGLYVSDNKVLSTGSDPDTPWSEFTVTVDATGGTFTWTSGIACTSHILKNTIEQDVGKIEIQPQVNKNLSPGGLEDQQFTFELKKVSTSPSDVPEPKNLPQEKKNDATGKITFDKLTFETDDTYAGIDGSSNFPYYPGTAPGNGDTKNESGKGVHNAITYTYEIKEIQGTDQNIIYDTSAHELKIVTYTPENDKELKQGIKAEIYVDGALFKTVWHSESYTYIENGQKKTLSDKWYDENGNEIANPNPINLGGIVFGNSKVPQKDTKSVTRTITYTEDNVGGNEVAPDKKQTVNLEKVWYLDSQGNPVDESGKALDLSTVPWTLVSGDRSQVKSPDHPKKVEEEWNPDKETVGAWSIDLLDPQDEVVNVIYKRDTYTESTETRTITRTITYTERTKDGKQVSKTVTQTVTLERTIRTNDRTGAKTYGKWIIKSGDTSAVSSPEKAGWLPDQAAVGEWEIDLNDPQNEVINVIYNLERSSDDDDDDDDDDDEPAVSKVIRKVVETGDETTAYEWMLMMALSLLILMTASHRRNSDH